MNTPFRTINPPLIEPCGVCDRQGRMKVMDVSCGLKVGDCCLAELTTAHRLIETVIAKFKISLSHPGMPAQ